MRNPVLQLTFWVAVKGILSSVRKFILIMFWQRLLRLDTYATEATAEAFVAAHKKIFISVRFVVLIFFFLFAYMFQGIEVAGQHYRPFCVKTHDAKYKKVDKKLDKKADIYKKNTTKNAYSFMFFATHGGGIPKIAIEQLVSILCIGRYPSYGPWLHTRQMA